MYLVIEEDFSVSQSKVLTGEIRARCRRGEISVVNTSNMRGMNTPEYAKEFGEWSDINNYSPISENAHDGINNRETGQGLFVLATIQTNVQ